MSERVIKLQSQQAFNETWKPASETPIHKLVDFTIPAGGQYDLSKSYININMETIDAQYAGTADSGGTVAPTKLADDTAFYNNEIVLDSSGNTNHYNASVSALVRNADLFSQNKGMVESIRSLNKLRNVMWNFENDNEEMHGGLDKFGTFQGRRGIENGTSSLLQIIGSNVNVNGVQDTGIKAEKRPRDFRIPLSDLFGVGNAMWNGDYFGDTQIHLELTPNRLKIEQLGGSERSSAFDGGDNFGDCEDETLANTNTLGVSNPISTKLTYKDYGLNFPFYVGQAVSVAYNDGAPKTKHTVIEAIEYNAGTNANAQPAGNEKVRIYTRDAIFTATGAITITGISVQALLSTEADDQIRINKAELVLYQRYDMVAPEGIDYITYTTEETQGNSATSYNKQILAEPSAHNLIVVHSATGEISADRVWNSYRLAINNVDVCGNRSVEYEKPLHKDRILRFFQNRSQEPHNLSLRLLGGYALSQQSGANQVKFYPIVETLPITENTKTVELELDSAGAQDVCFFKEVSRSI